MQMELYDSRGRPIQWQATDRGEALVQQAHAKYAEAVAAGRCFFAADDGSGNAPGTAIGTDGIAGLENPLGSGVRLVVLRVSMGYISGTLGAGTIFYTVDDDPSSAVPIATGTAITPASLLLGSGILARGKAWDNPTLLNTPTILRPFCSLGASLASSVVPPWQLVDDVDGEIVLNPGSVLAMEGVAAAGTSPLVAFGFTWEEVPI